MGAGSSSEETKPLKEKESEKEKEKEKEEKEKEAEKEEEELDPNLTEEEKNAHIKKRKCTDVLCILIFGLAMAGFAYVMRYAWLNGDTRRIYHGINWEGELCGVSNAVKAKPLLYWCRKPGEIQLSKAALEEYKMKVELKDALGHLVPLANKIFEPSETLDTLHPICLESCPVDRSNFHPCLQNVETEKQQPKNFDGTFWQNSTFISSLVQDVKTFTVARRFCLPEDNIFLELLNESAQASATQVLYGVAQVVEARKIFLGTGVLAVLASYAYMFTIDVLAYPVVYTVLFLCVAGPIATGLYFIYGAFHSELSHVVVVHVNQEWLLPTVPTTSDRNWDIIIATVCILVGIGVSCFWCCKRKSITFVIVAVKATIRVLYDVPSLLLLPAINTSARLLVLVVALWGFALIVSSGEVAAYDIHSLVPSGITRSFEHTQDEQLFILYYIFAASWVYELVLALQHFVVAYTVLIWYNAPLVNGSKKVPCLPILRANWVGLTYHLGSLAFGSVLLALLRVVYALVSLFYSQAKKKKEDEETNAVAATAAACCCCCLQCFEQVLRYLNQGAYVMVAVNSDNYCQGADRAISLVASEFVAIGALEGSTFLFQALGNILIPGLGGYATYLLVTHLEQFNSPSSVDYIAQPEIIAVVGAAVCLGISLSFMSIFDTVSDAMLFAFMTDEQWRKKHGQPSNPNVPENLQALLKEAEQ